MGTCGAQGHWGQGRVGHMGVTGMGTRETGTCGAHGRHGDGDMWGTGTRTCGAHEHHGDEDMWGTGTCGAHGCLGDGGVWGIGTRGTGTCGAHGHGGDRLPRDGDAWGTRASVGLGHGARWGWGRGGQELGGPPDAERSRGHVGRPRGDGAHPGPTSTPSAEGLGGTGAMGGAWPRRAPAHPMGLLPESLSPPEPHAAARCPCAPHAPVCPIPVPPCAPRGPIAPVPPTAWGASSPLSPPAPRIPDPGPRQSPETFLYEVPPHTHTHTHPPQLNPVQALRKPV